MAFTLKELEQTYPNVSQLVGGYFHQDWTAEYDDSPESALSDYILSSASEIELAIREIDSLLATKTDEDLASILVRLDNNYSYQLDGYSARTWLERIRMRLLGALASS